jgi:hypothetical protein
MRSRLLAHCLVSVVALAGCGSNEASVPSALLDAIGHQSETAGYPAGPYGVRSGDVVQNLCFQGWTDPMAAAYDTSHLTEVCLSDFHADPDATLLLVESCAIWCVACRAEYEGNGSAQPSLEQRLEQRKSKGFRILGTIFESADSSPATPSDAALWANTFRIGFPFVVDDEHKLGLFTSSNIAPFNILVDVKTMKVVLELSGDEPSVLFGSVDDFLASHGQ